MKRLISILTIQQLFIVQSLVCHGFGADTLVRNAHNAWWPIEQVCRNPQDLEQWVLSYKPHSDRCVVRRVKRGTRRKANCYMRLHFDESSNHDIVCTPTQQFYVPTRNKWVYAYQLKRGDYLLGECTKRVPITAVEFIRKSIRVYSIEVEGQHNFLVGHYCVLTHNTAASASFFMELIVPFGEGAAVGGGIGSYFGPITVVGGVVVGGIGVGLYSLFHTPNMTEDDEIRYDEESYAKYVAQNGLPPSNAKSGIMFMAGGGDPEPPDPNRGGHSTAGIPPDEPENQNKESNANSGYENLNETQLRKAKRTEEKNIREHQQKLETYKTDPYQQDNQNFLKNAKNDEIRQNIIKGRLDGLGREIRKFSNNIKKIDNELLKRGIK